MIDYCYRGRRAGEYGDVIVTLVSFEHRLKGLSGDDLDRIIECNRAIISSAPIAYPARDVGPFDWGNNSGESRRTAAAIIEHLLCGADVHVGSTHIAKVVVDFLHNTVSRLPVGSFEVWASDIAAWIVENGLTVPE